MKFVVDNQLALLRKPAYDVAVIIKCHRAFRDSTVCPDDEGIRPGSITYGVTRLPGFGPPLN